jgi:hypothetical protein
MPTGYLRALKQAVTGDPSTPLVLLCNFEVEQRWATGFPGLPAPSFSMTAPLVGRMEELGALLAGPDDYLILRRPLDPGYVDYVRALGLEPPTVLVPDDVPDDHGEKSTAARACRSPKLLTILRELGARGARLMPTGLSEDEVTLATRSGLPVAAPDLATVVAVNSKIYSRRLVEATGLRAVPGWCCETVGEFTELMERVGPGCRPDSALVVKDAYGVSGKGLVVLDDPTKARRVVRAATAMAKRRDDERLHVVVETWLPKRADLNYQFTVDDHGEVRLDFVKELITRGGVHLGHISPPELDGEQYGEVRQAADIVGKALFADGFTGVVGVDAVVTTAGTVYPVLEINARFNMSTYQGGVLEVLAGPGSATLAGQHSLRLRRPVPFADLLAALGPLTTMDPVRGGVVVTCFGTVNAMVDEQSGEPAEGRLYFIALGPDRAAVTTLAEATGTALDTITGEGR